MPGKHSAAQLSLHYPIPKTAEKESHQIDPKLMLTYIIIWVSVCEVYRTKGNTEIIFI